MVKESNWEFKEGIVMGKQVKNFVKLEAAMWLGTQKEKEKRAGAIYFVMGLRFLC